MEAFAAGGEWWSIGLPAQVPDRLMEGRQDRGWAIRNEGAHYWQH